MNPERLTDTIKHMPTRSTLHRRTFLRATGAGLGAAALAPLLAACGADGGGKGSGSGSKHIVYWEYTTPSEKQAMEYVKKGAAMYPKAVKGGTYDLVYVPADNIVTKLIGTGTNKSGPDVFESSGELDQLVPAGVVKDLSSYWDKYADKKVFPKAALGRRNGKLYAVQPYANLIGLWYNKDILDEFGITPPTTIDELGAALKKIGKKYVGLAIAGDNGIDADWQGRPFYTGYGFDYLKPELEPLKRTFTLLNDWREAGYLPADVATWTQVTSFPKFTAGGVAFCVNGNWQYGQAKSQATFKYGVVPMPKGPKGGTVYLGGEQFSVGAFAKNPDMAWKFLETTYLTKEADLLNLKLNGSIPLRTDLASASALQDPVVKQFQKEATERGTAYPDPGLGKNVGAARQAMGDGWNAMLSGAQSPETAAKGVVDKLTSLEK